MTREQTEWLEHYAKRVEFLAETIGDLMFERIRNTETIDILKQRILQLEAMHAADGKHP